MHLQFSELSHQLTLEFEPPTLELWTLLCGTCLLILLNQKILLIDPFILSLPHPQFSSLSQPSTAPPADCEIQPSGRAWALNISVRWPFSLDTATLQGFLPVSRAQFPHVSTATKEVFGPRKVFGHCEEPKDLVLMFGVCPCERSGVTVDSI